MKYSNRWLSVRARKEGKTIRRTIYKALNISLTDRIIGHLKRRKSWMSVLSVLILSNYIFAFCIPDFTFAGITYEVIKDILDNRISDYIALFGVSVAAAVFIIQTIQQKKNLQDLFPLIFQESWLYPIISFHLFVVLILNFTSLFREWLGYGAVSRLTMWNGSVLFIVAVYTILFLFHSIYRFVGTQHLFRKRKEFLRKHLIDSIISDSERFESLQIVNNCLVENNIEASSHYFGKDKNYIDFDLPSMGFVIDVNLKKLFKIVSQFTKSENINGNNNVSLTLNPLHLGERVHKNTVLLRVDKSVQISEEEKLSIQKNLRLCFTLRLEHPSNEYLTVFREQLDAQILNAVKDSDIEAVRNAIELYEIILDTFSHLQLHWKLNSFFEENRQWTALDKLSYAIDDAFNAIPEDSTVDLYSPFIYFYYYQVISGIQEKDIYKVQGNINYVFKYYRHHAKRNFNAKLFESSIQHFSQFVDIYLDRLLEESTEIDSINNINCITNEILFSIASLFMDIIKSKDVVAFNKLTNVIHQLELDKTEQRVNKLKYPLNYSGVDSNLDIESVKELIANLSISLFYLKSLRFLVWAWLIALYHRNLIQLDDYKNFSKVFKELVL